MSDQSYRPEGMHTARNDAQQTIVVNCEKCSCGPSLDDLLLVTREFIDETSIHLSRLLIRHGISNLNQLTGRQEGEDTGKAPRKS